jgi:hypothetical protein
MDSVVPCRRLSPCLKDSGNRRAGDYECVEDRVSIRIADRRNNAMQSLFITGFAAALTVAATAPAFAQEQSVKGKDAVAIVAEGNIRASSSEGFQGFLLLVEHRGKNYTCTLTATGQVQECYPLYW